MESNALLEVTVAERTTELRASEGRLRLLVESATDSAIITMDLTGQITHWNVGARNLLGWEPAEAIGQNIQIIFTPEDRAAGAPKAALGAALTEGRANEERWLQRKDGSRFFAAGALLPMRGGEAARPPASSRSCATAPRNSPSRKASAPSTRRWSASWPSGRPSWPPPTSASWRRPPAASGAEEQLRQAQKMEAIGQLTGGIAHDFNNLLTVIIGNLDIAAAPAATVGRDDRAARAIADTAMRRAPQRAAALTQRLLAFSRQQPLEPEAGRRQQAGRRHVGPAAPHARRGRSRIETVLAGGLWRADVDPSQLENALLNLAVNARDAMPDGGKLTIETANAYLDEAYAAAPAEASRRASMS